jgi:hypothetical protein
MNDGAPVSTHCCPVVSAADSNTQIRSVAENLSALVALWHAQLVGTISNPEIVEG